MKLLNIRPLHLDQLSSMADLADMQAEVYLREGMPVAVVLWEGNEARPHSLIKDSGDGGIVRGSLVFDDDIPKHDSRQTHLHVTVNSLVMKGEPAGIVIRKPEHDAGLYHYEEPPLAVIVSDKAVVPYDAHDMDAAVAYAKQIEQLFAGNLHAFAYEAWRLDPCGGALAEMQSITQQEFVASMYSRRTVQGDPVFPQPEGYEANGFTVGHDARVGDGDTWGKLRHLYMFDGVGYASVEYPNAGDKQLVMVKQADIQETREPLISPDQHQMAALRAFRDRNGIDWKDKLHQCWMSAKYPGMDADQAALLQQVRNTSAEWVMEAEQGAFDAPAHSQIVDQKMAHTSDAGARYLVSVNKEQRSTGSTAVEVERQTWGEVELRNAVPQFRIREASSTNLSDPYVWFLSDESLDGTRFALHIHEIDGREPAEADYRRIADALGIAVPRNDVTAEL
jgi:hypothetical protein